MEMEMKMKMNMNMNMKMIIRYRFRETPEQQRVAKWSSGTEPEIRERKGRKTVWAPPRLTPRKAPVEDRLLGRT